MLVRRDTTCSHEDAKTPGSASTDTEDNGRMTGDVPIAPAYRITLMFLPLRARSYKPRRYLIPDLDW